MLLVLACVCVCVFVCVRLHERKTKNNWTYIIRVKNIDMINVIKGPPTHIRTHTHVQTATTRSNNGGSDYSSSSRRRRNENKYEIEK